MVYLSSVQSLYYRPQHLGLMRYRGNLSGRLVLLFLKCKSPQLEESDWPNCFSWSIFVTVPVLELIQVFWQFWVWF